MTKIKFEPTSSVYSREGGVYTAHKGNESEPIVIDWGDGNVQSVDGLYGLNHTYSTPGTYWAKVYNVDAIGFGIPAYGGQVQRTLKEVVFGTNVKPFDNYVF